MNRIGKMLEGLGFNLSYNTSGLIATEMHNKSIWVDVTKDYKGYHLKITEWANNNFARIQELDFTKSKDIIKFIEEEIKYAK